jgi:hypothetical protein
VAQKIGNVGHAAAVNLLLRHDLNCRSHLGELLFLLRDRSHLDGRELLQAQIGEISRIGPSVGAAGARGSLGGGVLRRSGRHNASSRPLRE